MKSKKVQSIDVNVFFSPFSFHFSFLLFIFAPKNENNPTMAEETQFDQLQRLVHLIADDNELLNRANTFMQNLVNNKFDYRGRKDISAELAAKEKLNEGRHQ